MFVTDSGFAEITSKGLTTASKEGTSDGLDGGRHMGQNQQNVAAVVLPSSSSSSASAQASTYRPHAIVVNVVQVSGNRGLQVHVG